ncbi:MAG: hypothetical protein OEY14_15640, partial [Myxococcales bacterium]|nr:hypothetical protein [Myxococcales bacterium]
RHDFAARPAHTLSSRKEALKLTLYALLLAPLALWGFAHNVVPYRLTRWLSSRAPDEAMRAITAFLGGAVIYGLVYAAYGIALLRAGDSPWLVAAYLTSLPITGFWFLRYGRRLLRYRDRILVRTLFRTRRHLHRQLLFEREQLHITLGELRRFYEDHVARERERAAGLEPGDAMPARAPAPDA